MSKTPSKIEVVCPCCQATLVVDSKTGMVLRSREKKPDYSFDQAVEEIKLRKERSEELFQKAFSDEKKRQQSLEEKFRRALDSKEELDEPVRPLDLD